MLLRRSRQLFALGALSLSISTPAWANGRFPRAQRVLEHPSDSNRLVLAATYGLLVSDDRGLSWSYVCEPAFTHAENYVGDPLLDFTGDESLLVNVQGSISVSGADACDWKQTMGSESEFIVDHSVSRSNPDLIVAAVVEVSPSGVTNVLRISRDNGQTWSAVGSPIPFDTLYTVDIDPLDPEHLYATGVRDDQGQLASSEDQGRTWSTHPIANTDPTEVPYLAGIHPRDPQRLFVRTDSTRSVGDTVLGDALLYSDDGGISFREVFRAPAKLLGFALAPDGSSVLAGFGNPGLASSPRDPGTRGGVFMSSTDRFAFSQVYGGNVNCLTWTKTGVYVCADETRDGFELGFWPANDFGHDGSCLVPLLHRNEVRGPVMCGPNTSAVVCSRGWPSDCAPLGACASGGNASRAACLPFAPPDSSSGGTTLDGTGGSSATVGETPAKTAGTAKSEGCACHIATSGSPLERTSPLLFALVGFFARRRAKNRRLALSAR